MPRTPRQFLERPRRGATAPVHTAPQIQILHRIELDAYRAYAGNQFPRFAAVLMHLADEQEILYGQAELGTVPGKIASSCPLFRPAADAYRCVPLPEG